MVLNIVKVIFILYLLILFLGNTNYESSLAGGICKNANKEQGKNKNKSWKIDRLFRAIV